MGPERVSPERLPLSPGGASPAGRARLVTAALLLPAYGWLLVAVFLPLGAMLVFSFLRTNPFGSRAPLGLTTANYLAFGTRPYLVSAAWASLRLGFWTTGICAAVGLPAALAIARATRGRVRQTVFLLPILPFWTNGLVRIFSWTMLLREGGIIACEAPRHPLAALDPVIRAGLIETARRLDPLVLRWAR